MKAWILKIQKKKKKDSTQNYKRLIWEKDTLNEKEITPNILFNVSRKHQEKKKRIQHKIAPRTTAWIP